MLSDEVTTGSLTTSDVHKRAFALRSHEWNLSQPRFKEAFPEVSLLFSFSVSISSIDFFPSFLLPYCPVQLAGVQFGNQIQLHYRYRSRSLFLHQTIVRGDADEMIACTRIF